MKVRAVVVEPRIAWEATAWRILREVHLRYIAQQQGLTLGRMTETARSALLEPKELEFLADWHALCETLAYAHSTGIERVHTRLHARPGVDNEMLDQAVEYAGYELSEDAKAHRFR